MKNRYKLLIIFLSLILTGCVNQYQQTTLNNSAHINERDITQNKIKDPRIVVTSMSSLYIFEKLNLDLVGIPDSKIDKVPKKYENLPKIGMAMNPDLEKIKLLNADYIFSPVSLMSDLLPKYESLGINYGFINLNNIEGMYKSIEDLGILFNRKEESTILVEEYKTYIKNFNEKYKDKESPKVLILMGLPGSYVVATDKSYVGSLVELAGGKNVYGEENDQFVNINTEDMLEKDPDIILRTSHANPEEVLEMFKKDFESNDIWKHFKAVKEDEVYDLDNKKFGMSAKFNYPESLQELGEIFYGK